MQPLGDDGVRHGVDEGDVGAGQQRAGGGRPRRAGPWTRSMRRGSATMIWAPARSRRFSREAKTGWASVGLAPISRTTSAALDRAEVLGAGRRAEGLLEPVAGGGVADAGAGVDVVVAEGGPHHLLDDVDLLVGAARRRDAADRRRPRAAPGSRGTPRPPGRSPRPRRPPATPRRSSRAPSGTSWRSAVVGVAVGEAALHAGVALVGACRPSSGIIRTTRVPSPLALSTSARKEQPTPQ